MQNTLDVLEAGKWKKALFTTYTLSLSFFESILLRKLRQNGCQEVWVISDLHGCRDSLIERRSRAIGHEYRLIPMRLPKGVFHPKCLYLEGTDEDALAIGSGNLTFGGFGRNLEVLEVFSSRQTPEIFLDFAEFLDSLRLRGRSRMSEFGLVHPVCGPREADRLSAYGADQSAVDHFCSKCNH